MEQKAVVAKKAWDFVEQKVRVLEDKQELIDIIETIYRGAKKGRGLVVSPKGE